MYYSNMWEYGVHDTTVGITGFMTCAGVVFVTNQQLYAIHIPFVPERYVAARAAFGMLIAQTEAPNVEGDILVFCNGATRPDIVNEVQPLIDSLNVRTNTLHLLNGAGLNNGGNAAAVQVHRLVEGMGGFGVSVKYEVNDNINWVAGGTAPSGSFNHNHPPNGSVVPNGHVNWMNVTALNSQISQPW